jgi:hypothetical protein
MDLSSLAPIASEYCWTDEIHSLTGCTYLLKTWLFPLISIGEVPGKYKTLKIITSVESRAMSAYSSRGTDA